jgi:glycosyltransferase involved in cell wall biosynthesis
MQLKLVSIILPVYNVEKYIAKSIQSVLNQTYTYFELLVVIDGSPDNSKQIAVSFSDERITIYEKENGGLSDARNYGLERAKGEYIYFMDSDDWIEPNLLEDCIEVLEREKLELVIFGYTQDVENTQSSVIKSNEFLPHIDKLIKVDSNITISNHLLGIMGYAWNKLYRRSFLLNNNSSFEKGISLVEDALFNFTIYQKLDKIYFINKSYYHYLDRPIQTLIKTFHNDSFNLQVKRNYIIENFLTTWCVKNKNELLGFIHIQSLRYSIHTLYAFKNKLSTKQKIGCIKMMVYNDNTKKNIHYYKPITFVDSCYKALIKYKCSNLIGLTAFLKKK